MGAHEWERMNGSMNGSENAEHGWSEMRAWMERDESVDGAR